MKSNIPFINLFPFSAYFLSNGFLQCMDIYLYWEKPDWLCCQYWIRPNIAASTRNPRVSRNHEKSSYRTNCQVFIITLFNPHSCMRMSDIFRRCPKARKSCLRWGVQLLEAFVSDLLKAPQIRCPPIFFAKKAVSRQHYWLDLREKEKSFSH